jgi:hypothetical protein
MTNRTGTNSIKGTVVSIAFNQSLAFTNYSDGFTAIGVVYENGISNGSLCDVVVAGIAEVLLQSNTYSTNGEMVYSTTNGTGQCQR